MGVATITGRFVGSDGQPIKGLRVRLIPLVRSGPLADESGTVAYTHKPTKTDDNGDLIPVEVLDSNALGVTIPWRALVTYPDAHQESFDFIAYSGTTVDLTTVAHVPSTAAEFSAAVVVAQRIEAAAASVEAAAGDLLDAPSFVEIYETRLV